MRPNNPLAWLIAAVFGVLGTIQYHLGQFTTRFDTFFGDRGDARGFVYFLEHWYQAFQGKTNLLSPGIFYPVKGTLAYSDLLLGFAIPYSIFRALGFSMFVSTEIVVILLTFLSFLACFALLYRTLRFALLPSCAGAMFFAFNSPKFFQTGHLQLQFVLSLPLIFICVILFVQKSEKLSQKKATVLLCLAALLLELQLLTAFYHAWFFVFWSVLFLALAMVIKKSRVAIIELLKKYRRAIIATAAFTVVSIVPFLLVYIPAIKVGSWYPYRYVTEMIPEWWSLLSMGDGNYLWGSFSSAVMPDPPPATWGELKIGIGLVPSIAWIVITVWAVFLLKKSSKTQSEVGGKVRAAAPVFLAITVLATTLFYLLAFKYNGHSPWIFVYYTFPGARAIRAISRYVIFLALPMSSVFAYVLNSAQQWIATHKTRGLRIGLSFALLLVAGFGVFEQFGVFKVGGTGFSKRTEQKYLDAMRSKLTPDCQAFYVAPGPKGNHNPFEYQYDAMLISIMSGIPTLNASSSQFPPNWLLYLVKDPAYEDNVKNWIKLNGITSKVCRLEIGPQVEAFEAHATSPVDDPTFFVTQHYLDFLGREPTADELNRSVALLKNCKPGDVSCDRVQISLNLFNSTDFYNRGAFILRLYQVGLGRLPTSDEFTSDLAPLAAVSNGQLSESAKRRFIDGFAERPEFVARYHGLTDAQYVEKLLRTAEVMQSEALPNDFTPMGKTRGEILDQIISSDAVGRKLSNGEFVTLQYLGYLRRVPDPGGFSNWFVVLNRTGDFRHVTSGFIDSIEYRNRF